MNSTAFRRRVLLCAWFSLGTIATARSQSAPICDELHRMVALDRTFPLLGDLDGDGDLDIPFRHASGAFSALLNDGSGHFAAEGTASDPYQPYVQDMRLVDLDGDGDLDLLSLGGAIGPVSCATLHDDLWINDGAGNFALHATAFASGNNSVDLDVGDIDADGDADVLIAGYSVSCNAFDHLWINNGSGGFQSASLPFTSAPAHTRGVAFADIEGDGDLDFVLCGDAGTQLWRNDGALAFTEVSAQLPSLAPAFDAAFGDVDGDGDVDALVFDQGVRLWLNDGAGTFSDASAQLPGGAGNVYDLVVVDLDNDGDLDVVIGSSYGDQVLENDGAGFFSDATATRLPGPPAGTWRLALGDVDGDGDVDGLFSAIGEDLRLNDGTGRLRPVPVPRVPETVAYQLDTQVGDVDGNGGQDIVGLAYGSGALEVLRNDGHGDFALDSQAFPGSNGYPVALELGDFDRDGDLDVFTANWSWSYGPAADALYLNAGDGTFANASSNLPTLIDRSRDVVSGDVDNDGDLDLLIATLPGATRLYLGDGHGHFSNASSQIAPAPAYSMVVELGDVDSDGDLDAYVGLDFGAQLLVNDGTGRFTQATVAFPPHSGSPLCAAFGDMDGDGDLDLVVGTYSPDPAAPAIDLFLNVGSLAFAYATTQIGTYATFDVTRVQTCDLDADGDLDILGSKWPQGVVLLNTGAGQFIDGTTLVTGGRQPALALDFDSDTDIDVVDMHGHLLTNTLRQVAWRQIPRTGRKLDIDVFGPSNGHFILLAARDPVGAVHTAFGAFGLLRSTIFRIDKGPLDTHGRANVRIDVPDDPALVGRDYFWQALVGRPARLTNVERTLFSGL